MRCTIFPKAASIFGLIMLAGCTQQMADQPEYRPLRKSEFFPDSLSARPLPEGVIPRDYADKTDVFDSGMVNGQPTEEFPMPITATVLSRGRQRYDIFCSPCHDYLGTGNGMAARRGFRRHPASFHTEDLLSSPPGHFFDVITNGFGAMQPYAKQIVPEDRWAIVAYIRALQFSQSANISDVPPDDRRRLEAEKR